MMQRIGQSPETGTVYRYRPGAYALLPLGDRLLVTLEAGAELELQLPGGGIDPGENPLEALHREVLEETGWRIARPRKIWTYRRFVWMPDYGRRAEKVCHIYVAHPVRRLRPPSEPDHKALLLPAASAARLLASPGDRIAAERLMC